MVYENRNPYTGKAMRTNIDIDDGLLASAMSVTGLTSKKATVEEALRRLVNRHERMKALQSLKGLGWDDPEGGFGSGQSV